MVQLFQPLIKAGLKVLMPEEAGIFQAGTQNALPAVLNQGQGWRRQVQHCDKVRQKLPVPVLDAKALLMRLHAGNEHFPGNFQEFLVKVAKKAHRMLDQAYYFLHQGIVPQNPAANCGSSLVCFPDYLFPAHIAKRLHTALFTQNGNKIFCIRDFKGAFAMHPVAIGCPAALDRADLKGNDLGAKQGNNPLQGTAVGKVMILPAHALGKGYLRNNGGGSGRQDDRGSLPADTLFHGNVFALCRCDRIGILRLQAMAAHKAFQGLGGCAVLVGGTHRRTHKFFFLFFLHVGHVVNDDNGPARGGTGMNGAMGQRLLFQLMSKLLCQKGLFACQKTGGQFLAANFQDKS